MSEAPVAMTGGRRKAALGFIFATALMDVIALGLMIPVLPNLVKQLVGGDTATATIYTGMFAVSWGLLQFVCSPIQGMLSDRFGRRPVLLLSIFGLGIDYMFMALAPTLAWLFVGRLINGVTSASFSTAAAYVADITPPQDRAKNFGLMGAAFSLGFIIGPAIGGVLGDPKFMGGIMGDHYLRLPFYVSAAMALANWLYGFFILPESLPPERRAKRFDWAKANPVGSFRLLQSHHELLGFATIATCFQLAHNVFPSIFVLYTGHRFGWGPREVGLMLLATGAVSAVTQFFLVRPIVQKIGERGALIVGLISGILGFAIYGLAPDWKIFCIGIPVFALANLIGPSNQALMSQRVKPNEQGQLQGANSAIMGICAIIGPLVFTQLFALTIRHLDVARIAGLPILVSSFLMMVALGLTLRTAKPVAEPAAA